mmetsp:Transcript_32771/g.52530  ORF Transcript_32771/g.52530 Transcript_32771/m.52530 type:complete len:298 (-) Transcript_32771:10-903(-)|eukprot:CAMPEP_0181361126 /NCGR_PEP_ID=MMETSP1106-20121128/7099_1 /TAXON_ID=81844 /ORGANISM="Mantoniella antarctica, Strain SL-175" /LENGTH=297 /DNA_ID=CAMNT_0023474577 /DNA_START=227 /DNA_END=1120 /DNA_ORIENTATION=+
MSFFGLGKAVTMDLTYVGGEHQRTATVKSEQGAMDTLALFTNGDTISGHVHLTPSSGKKVEHLGVKIEVLGQIELYFDRGNAYDFVSLVREVAPPGELSSAVSIPFEFSRVEMPHESYHGINVRLRYLLRVTMQRSYGNTVVQEFKYWVRTTGIPPEVNHSIKMEVGIEDCLHIEFEYARAKYHLKDVVVGKIFFLLVRIKIKHMEVEIRRRESTGSGPNTYNESETIAKYEVMDGAPVRGESIPVRLFLSPYDLTPTYKNVSNRFSVKYYLNLVLVDEEDRRYFKQQEIVLYRHEL